MFDLKKKKKKSPCITSILYIDLSFMNFLPFSILLPTYLEPPYIFTHFLQDIFVKDEYYKTKIIFYRCSVDM